MHTTAFSRTFSNFSKFLWCYLMWDGKLSLCFEFHNPNSFGRWKYLRCVHFSILNCTQRLFLKRFQTFPISDDVIECGMVNWASSFEFQHPIPFGRWKYLRRVHFSILNCTRHKYFHLLNELGYWYSKHKHSVSSHIGWHHKKLEKFENVWEKAVVCNLVY